MERIEAEVGALRAELENFRARSFIAQDERLYFFSKAMPESIGSNKNSIVSRTIQKDYHGRCLFCGEEMNVTKAHIVAGNNKVDYSPFSTPTYRDDLDVNSPRNFLPLCGNDGMDGTCHNEFDKFLMTLLYNPFEKVFKVYCLRKSFHKYNQCHLRVVNVSPTYPPYCRLLAWRTRKCVIEHQWMIPGEVDEWIRLSTFSEKSHSMVDETETIEKDTESNSKESGL